MLGKIKDFFQNEIKRSILFLVISGIALAISFFLGDRTVFHPAWIAIVLCGIPIVKEAAVGLVTAFDIKADVLVSIALIASIITGEIFAAGEVAFIMQIGSLLEELTVAKARRGIEKLVQLTPRTARILQGGEERIVPAEEVRQGAILRVFPGETIPVDGLITKGQTSIDQAVMTGESLPVDKAEGDEVSSGTINQFGVFEMQATKVGEDSSIQRMIRLVKSANADKAKIVGIADRWATWIVVIALTAAIGTWIFSGEIIRAVTILVVFCPCALVLATPTAIMAAIGNATKYGILVREGDALERLSKIQCITFDKTGTLTYGQPKVVAVQSFSASLSASQLYALVASSEQPSEHPLGRAVVSCYREETGCTAVHPDHFTLLPGKGVHAVLGEHDVLAGNTDLLTSHQVKRQEQVHSQAETHLAQGCTIIYVAVDGEEVGFLALADTMRENAPATVSQIRKLNIAPILLTGDHQFAARYIAKQAGIDHVVSDCLPEDKLATIKAYQDSGKPVCMVGDGINDAPALSKAYVGIAMGGIGSDIAVEAADIALVSDDISRLPHLLQLSRRMMTTITCNMIFSMGLNFLAIVLAITGILGPVWGALVHNAGSVVVIMGSAMLLKWRQKGRPSKPNSISAVPPEASPVK